jgi:hypothetical protein
MLDAGCRVILMFINGYTSPFSPGSSFSARRLFWHISCDIDTHRKDKMMRFSLISTLLLFLLMLSCSGEEKIVEVPVAINYPPTPPTGVSAINADGYIIICWYPSNVADIDHYEIYRALNYDGPFEYVRGFRASYPEPYDYCADFDATNGVQYFYAVRAFDTSGLASEYSLDYVTATPRPESPSLLTLNEYTVSPDLSGYNFSSLSGNPQNYLDETTDVYYAVVENGFGENVPYIVAYRTGVEIQDYGYVGLTLSAYDVIYYAPDEGWSPTRKAEAIAGHCYILRIPDEDGFIHYAKITLIEITPSYVKFYWAYQTDPGNRDLIPAAPDEEQDDRAKALEIQVGRLHPPSLREGSTGTKEHL